MFDSELFKESRLHVQIATGAKETLPVVELGSQAFQADALWIELAGPGTLFHHFLLKCQCFSDNTWWLYRAPWKLEISE